jgi:murein DD-endopeptidase MepM/ murein hydrolase activator NlpD
MKRVFLNLNLTIALMAFLLSSACKLDNAMPSVSSVAAPPKTSSKNTLDDYMRPSFTPADGFDFPFGDPDGKGSYTDKATNKTYDGWYIATRFNEKYDLGIHPGEDWNGSGGGNTDLGQDVFSVANGKVVFADHCGKLWGNVIVIEHIFYENYEKRIIHSLYAHLQEIKVKTDQLITRRQLIGAIGQDPDKTFNAHLHLELRSDTTLPPTYWPSSNGRDQSWVKEHYLEPSAFIKSHRRLLVPQKEEKLLLVDQETYKMRFYQKGKLSGEYNVSFGQEKGRKRLQGDNKTPKGMYFVIQKHRGKFDGAYGNYYGGHWIKINYPNKYDAGWGEQNGLISKTQSAKIANLWEHRAPTLESTKLGGGIGFHGWIKEWSEEGPRHLSWGCVVMHIYDISKLYDHVDKGTMVVIM